MYQLYVKEALEYNRTCDLYGNFSRKQAFEVMKSLSPKATEDSLDTLGIRISMSL